jgi:TolB-like protein/DNA-binding winged helix-turn-helix (wHTH) protein/Tfp pilus assembly protein PilF
LEVLNVLLSRAGDVVTRDELREKLWSSDTFVDFERGLNGSVKELRAALGDSAADGQYIETLVRLGYRFIAPVEVIERSLSAASPPLESQPRVLPEQEVLAESISASNSATRKSLWRWGFVLGAVIVAVAAIAYFQISRARARRTIATGKIMLAVLPFENLTGDSSQDYFSDGLTEEMIAQLGHLDPGHIGVIARTSVMHYKNAQLQLPQIAQELGVQYVLEGSVRRDSGKVRINAQLIQVKDQVPLWSRQYDRELSHLLVLQGEIAQDVGEEILLALGDGASPTAGHSLRTPATTPYEAYDSYLKGLYFWNKRTAQAFRQAAEYFQRAIDKDPNYARAYAGLADTYALMSTYDFASQSDAIPKGRAAALKALQIDPTLAEAHASLALIAENYDRDWVTAEKEYLRAIQLDPDYATAHHWYAECLGFQARFDEAFAESERARKLDPLSLIIAADYGALLYYSRQYDRAIAEFRKVLEMEPNFPRAYVLIYALVQKGSYPEALVEIDNWSRLIDTPWPLAVQIYAYGRSGQLAEARRGLEKLERLDRQRHLDPALMLMANLGLGNNEETFLWLQRCYDEHSRLTTLKVDPIYDPLRSDPRFQDFLRRVGLAN